MHTCYWPTVRVSVAQKKFLSFCANTADLWKKKKEEVVARSADAMFRTIRGDEQARLKVTSLVLDPRNDNLVFDSQERIRLELLGKWRASLTRREFKQMLVSSLNSVRLEVCHCPDVICSALPYSKPLLKSPDSLRMEEVD